jgi:hypothetical protein
MRQRSGLTNEIQALAIEFLGREITEEEIRLYPYLDYVSKNDCKLDFDRVRKEERDILERLRDEGRIKYDHAGERGVYWFAISEGFYFFIQRVLWIAVANYYYDEKGTRGARQ